MPSRKLERNGRGRMDDHAGFLGRAMEPAKREHAEALLHEEVANVAHIPCDLAEPFHGVAIAGAGMAGAAVFVANIGTRSQHGIDHLWRRDATGEGDRGKSGGIDFLSLFWYNYPVMSWLGNRDPKPQHLY